MLGEKIKLVFLYTEDGIPRHAMLEYHPIWTSFPFPFPVCVQCHLTDVLPLSVPCMLVVFPHRPHLLVHCVHLHGVVLQVSASGVCTHMHGYMVTCIVLRPLTSGASKTLIPVLSLKVCITCPSYTDEPLKPVSGDPSLRGSDIFAQKVNSEYSCVSCEVHQLTEMCHM